MATQFYNTETEIAASIMYPDSKTELSLLRETKTLLISHYEEADSDVPDKQISLNLIETQALFKLFNSSPEISPLLELPE